jgi:hypothetical protein
VLLDVIQLQDVGNPADFTYHAAQQRGSMKKFQDRVAAAVVGAVAREKFELVVCRDAKVMRLVSRLAPSSARWAFAWAERNNRMGG